MKTKTIFTLKTLLMTILAGASLCFRPHAAVAQMPYATEWRPPYETALFAGPLELNDVYRTDRLPDANMFMRNQIRCSSRGIL